MLKKLLIIIITTLCFADLEHEACEETFSIDEVFFNEDIVGYYIAAFGFIYGSIQRIDV